MQPPTTASARQEGILAFLRQRPGGVARHELEGLPAAAGLDPQRLRRLLAPLVKDGRIRVEGATQARRYFPGNELTETLPLSPEGRAALARVLRPDRIPAVYHRPFLDTYQPNEVWYLPMELRHHLAGLGRAGDRSRRPALLADLAWNSARLDGAATSRTEAEALFSGGEAAPEDLPLLNHKAATDWMAGAEGADPVTVQNLHALLTDGLLEDPGAGGRLRTGPLALPGTRYLPPEAPGLVEWCFRQILRTASRILDPYEQAFFLLVHLPYLQPFAQANGSVARLAANLPLLRRQHVPVTFAAVPAQAYAQAMRAVWEENDPALLRDVFAFAVEHSCGSSGPDPFRLRYRAGIRTAVREAVLAGETGAGARIRAIAARLPAADGPRFRTEVDAELSALHDGNFARFQLTAAEFAAWKERR